MNEATHFHHLFLAVIDLVQGQDSFPHALGCYYCEFGRPDRENPHKFWAELWELLSQRGVDADVVSSELFSELAKCDAERSDPCSRLLWDRVLERIARHMR